MLQIRLRLSVQFRYSKFKYWLIIPLMDDDVITPRHNLYNIPAVNGQWRWNLRSASYNSPAAHIEIQISSLGPIMKNHFGHSRICFDQGAAESRQMYTIKNNGTFGSIQEFSMVAKRSNLSTENFHRSSYRLHRCWWRVSVTSHDVWL